MKLTKICRLTLLMTFLFIQACGGSGGGSGSSSSAADTPAAESTPASETFSVSSISIPETVVRNQQTTISAEITGKESEIILFQFQSENGINHMVPFSGIIATKGKKGQVKFAYKAPDQAGKRFYYLKVLNSDGEEIIKEFNINVVN